MKKYLTYLPDLILIAGFAITGIMELIKSDSIYGALFALGFAVLLTIQLIFKLRIISIVSSSLLICFGFWMVLAVISEFSEFPSIKSPGAFELLSVGLSIFLSILVLSFLIARRNVLRL